MFSLLFDRVVFLLLALHAAGLGFTTADDFNNENMERAARRDKPGMWFGPRLGKRSLDTEDEGDRQDLYKMLEAADTLKYFFDQLQNYESQTDDPGSDRKVTKKVSPFLFTPKLGRSLGQRAEAVEFTPRLGRRRMGDLGAPDSPNSYREDTELVEVVRHPKVKFSPRLGRNMDFSPRLGRDLIYDLYPESVRVARSTNDTKSQRENTKDKK